MSFLDSLRRLIPTRTVRQVIDLRQEPAAVAHLMDVDRLAQVLREAEAGNMESFFSVARDIVGGHSHAQAEFAKRKLAVVGDDMRLEEYSDRPEDAALVQPLEANLDGLEELLDVLLHLLDSTLYPVAVVEKIYRPSAREGWHYELDELRVVPHRLLDYSTGELRIWDVDSTGSKTGTSHAPDRMRYIVHRGHPLTNLPDTWGGPMRAVVFWWLFSVMDRHWWARFLDRFGAPFMVAKYSDTDDAARAILTQAFQTASKVFGLAVPKHVDIELQQAALSGAGDAFEKFHAVANQELSKVIIGQTLSAQGQNLGLGGGQASVQEGVRQDIRQFDATRLGHTLRTQLLEPLRRLNGWAGRAPRMMWGGESAAELSAIGDILPGLANAGLEPTDEGIDILSSRLGFGLRRVAAAPRPDVGQTPAGRLSPMSAPDVLESRSEAARRATDAIAREAAPDLAVALGVRMRDVAELLERSSDVHDFERRLRERFSHLDLTDTAQVVAEVLSANSANAILHHRTA